MQFELIISAAALSDLGQSSWKDCNLSRVAWPAHNLKDACFDGACMLSMVLTSSDLSSASLIRRDNSIGACCVTERAIPPSLLPQFRPTTSPLHLQQLKHQYSE